MSESAEVRGHQGDVWAGIPSGRLAGPAKLAQDVGDKAGG